MRKIITIVFLSLLFTFFLCSSAYSSTGLGPIASFSAFAVFSNVILAALLLTWIVIHWSNKTTQQNLLFRTVIDAIVIVFGSFSLWFWGRLFYKLTYGDGLWKTVTAGYSFIFYKYRLAIFFIMFALIIYALNKWISSISRIMRYFIHFSLCILLTIGILMVFSTDVAGPVTRLFVNSKELTKIDNSIDYLRWSDLYGLEIDEKSIAASPKYARAYNQIGYHHFYKGEYEKAISDFLKAIDLDPTSVTAYKNISWLLSTCVDQRFRDGLRAIDFIEKAIKERDCINIRKNDLRALTCAESFHVLAAAYAEVGKFAEASTAQKKAISIAKEDGYEALAGSYEKFLESYKNHKPWREKRKRFHRFGGI